MLYFAYLVSGDKRYKDVTRRLIDSIVRYVFDEKGDAYFFNFTSGRSSSICATPWYYAAAWNAYWVDVFAMFGHLEEAKKYIDHMLKRFLRSYANGTYYDTHSYSEKESMLVAILCRLHALTGERKYLEIAEGIGRLLYDLRNKESCIIPYEWRWNGSVPQPTKKYWRPESLIPMPFVYLYVATGNQSYLRMAVKTAFAIVNSTKGKIYGSVTWSGEPNPYTRGGGDRLGMYPLYTFPFLFTGNESYLPYMKTFVEECLQLDGKLCTPLLPKLFMKANSLEGAQWCSSLMEKVLRNRLHLYYIDEYPYFRCGEYIHPWDGMWWLCTPLIADGHPLIMDPRLFITFTGIVGVNGRETNIPLYWMDGVSVENIFYDPASSVCEIVLSSAEPAHVTFQILPLFGEVSAVEHEGRVLTVHEKKYGALSCIRVELPVHGKTALKVRLRVPKVENVCVRTLTSFGQPVSVNLTLQQGEWSLTVPSNGSVVVPIIPGRYNVTCSYGDYEVYADEVSIDGDLDILCSLKKLRVLVFDLRGRLKRNVLVKLRTDVGEFSNATDERGVAEILYAGEARELVVEDGYCVISQECWGFGNWEDVRILLPESDIRLLVLDGKGRYLSSCEVLIFPKGGSFVVRAEEKEFGGFEAPDLPLGTYEVRVFYMGRLVKLQTIEFNGTTCYVQVPVYRVTFKAPKKTIITLYCEGKSFLKFSVEGQKTLSLPAGEYTAVTLSGESFEITVNDDVFLEITSDHAETSKEIRMAVFEHLSAIILILVVSSLVLLRLFSSKRKLN